MYMYMCNYVRLINKNLCFNTNIHTLRLRVIIICKYIFFNFSLIKAYKF